MRKLFGASYGTYEECELRECEFFVLPFFLLLHLSTPVLPLLVPICSAVVGSVSTY